MSTFRSRSLSWISFVLCIALAPAQTITTGTIVGTVTDSSGAVVRGAAITLEHTATGEHRSAVSGDDGQYRFSVTAAG